MNAALQLGLTDPEDSDVNAIFEGIRVYDELKSQGIDAQIASISGNTDVGLKSDQILSQQLDLVLKESKRPALSSFQTAQKTSLFSLSFNPDTT